MVVRSRQRSRRCGRPARRSVRQRLGASKLAHRLENDEKVQSPCTTPVPLDHADICESDIAATAASAFLRRVASVGPEASLSEIAEKWGRLCALAEKRPDILQTTKRRVHFAKNDLAIVHECTPYAEIYGLHPREFVFGRNFSLIPSGGDFGFVDFLTARRRNRHGSLGGGPFEEDMDDSYESESEDDDW